MRRRSQARAPLDKPAVVVMYVMAWHAAYHRLPQLCEADDVTPRLERRRVDPRAYEVGEMSYLAVIEALRRLNDGRINELDAAIATRRALIQLEHRIGRSCTK